MSRSPLYRHAIQGAARGNPDLEQVLKGLHDAVELVAQGTGVPLASEHTPTKPITSIQPPGQPQWTVSGLDGKYIIVIIPLAQTQPLSVAHRLRLRKTRRPVSSSITRLEREDMLEDQDFDFGPPKGLNLQQTQVLYQMQSCTTQLFDAAGGVLTYGPDPKTVWEIQDPNQIKYWRLRSKYINSDWSAWYPYTVDPVFCGAVAVSSGFLRSTSLGSGSPANQTNTATVDSVDSGSDATVRVYGSGGVGSSWTQTVGSTTTTYPAVTFLHQPYDKDMWVYYDTSSKAFSITTNYLTTLGDSKIYVGYVHTVKAGGSGGISGGGGSDGSGGAGGRGTR